MYNLCVAYTPFRDVLCSYMSQELYKTTMLSAMLLPVSYDATYVYSTPFLCGLRIIIMVSLRNKTMEGLHARIW